MINGEDVTSHKDFAKKDFAKVIVLKNITLKHAFHVFCKINNIKASESSDVQPTLYM